MSFLFLFAMLPLLMAGFPESGDSDTEADLPQPHHMDGSDDRDNMVGTAADDSITALEGWLGPAHQTHVRCAFLPATFCLTKIDCYQRVG